MLAGVLKYLASRLAACASTLRPAGPPASGDDLEAVLRHAGQAYQAGDLSAARTLYQDVLQRDGENEHALYHLGVIAGRSGNYADAHQLLNKVVARNPHWDNAWNALANIEKLRGRWGEAEDLYRRTLALNPDSAAVWSNLGQCLRQTGQFDAAEAALRRALELRPDFAGALLNLAMTAVDQGRPQQALELVHRSLMLDPDLAEAHTGLAQLLLQNSEFASGWREYEWRLKREDVEYQPQHPFPRWDGSPIKNRVLLVRAEQGLGDQIMFASCLPDAIERSGTCLLECDPRLAKLFARSFAQAQVFPYHAQRNPKWAGRGHDPDCQIHLGSLPGLFRQQAADFPQHGAYLRADLTRIEHWRARLGEVGVGRKIGISWRGGVPSTRRTLRSVALAEMLPILQQQDAVFVSLQYGDCQAELAEFSRASGIAVTHWQQALDDYDETAALVCALDLVISVQTSVVHLAGALGRPGWVLVPAVPEWRYMQSGDSMPWYPSLRLFRQQQVGQWQPVIAKVALELGQSV